MGFAAEALHRDCPYAIRARSASTQSMTSGHCHASRSRAGRSEVYVASRSKVLGSFLAAFPEVIRICPSPLAAPWMRRSMKPGFIWEKFGRLETSRAEGVMEKISFPDDPSGSEVADKQHSHPAIPIPFRGYCHSVFDQGGPSRIRPTFLNGLCRVRLVRQAAGTLGKILRIS